MIRTSDAIAASLGVILGILTPGCPSSVPPPVAATRLAYDVETSLEAAHCAPDGGLPALEAMHARFDAQPWVQCIFTPTGSIQSCNVPCPLP